MIANCVVCGKEFLKTNSSQKTCSVECSKQNRRNKKKAAYWAAHDKYLQRKRTYNKEHREELRLAAQVRRAKKPKNTYKCVVCGASFLKNMRNGNAITCSAECSKINERQKNKERYRAYYESNKERYSAYWKKKYAENPSFFKEKAKRYRIENPEKYRQQKRNYAAKNPSVIKESRRRYIERHPDKRKESAKKWFIKDYYLNPLKYREMSRKRSEKISAFRIILENNFIATKGLSRSQILRLGQKVLENQQFLQAVSN
jgi:predicted nucleic acid-binding Zn ribbon protein